jgi:hydrogenase maturation protein HypF
MVVEVAKKAQCPIVALTGGCFQNALLLELTISALNRAGLQPIWHTHVPPNDGGLSLGQAVIASRQLSMQTLAR